MRCCKCSSVILVLFWLVLIRTADPNYLTLVEFDQHFAEIYKYLLVAIRFCFFLSLPFAGLYSDIKLGRLNTVLITAGVDVLATVLFIIDGFLKTTWITGIASPLSIYLHKFMIIVSLSLGANQLIDASSQELSHYIWWYSWSLSIGWLVSAIAKCTGDSGNIIFNVTLDAVHLLCVLVILLTGVIGRRAIANDVVTDNPLKVISKVVNYARKNKFPANRSALTYWQNRHPSRIDLGKRKYGGPFNEEVVEDVKTFFYILPIIFSMTIGYLPMDYHELNVSIDNETFYQCLISSTYTINYIINIVFIPLYICCSSYAIGCHRVSMLRKIGLGIFLIGLSKVGYILIEVFRHDIKNEFNFNSTITNLTTYSNVYYFCIVPDVVRGFGSLLTFPAGLEFVFAQSPYSMRGFLIGLWYSCCGVYAGIGRQFSEALTHYWLQKSFSGIPVLLMFNLGIIVIGLLVYAILSNRYKLRIRQDVYNGYAVVEDYYINEFDKREQCHYGSLSI